MTDHLHSIELDFSDANEAQNLFGTNDLFLKQIENHFQISLITRGASVLVKGTEEDALKTKAILQTLQRLIQKGASLSERDVIYAIQLSEKDELDRMEELFADELLRNIKGKPIRVKTLGQKRYISAMKRNDLVFGIGPAGTGKTYLAVVMAVAALKEGNVKRIILTRPAVEAGESLGFLPGDLKEKVDPYLRPLYDALHDVFGVEQTVRLMDRGTIEIAPLAYMRGRTLEDAFVILDEAQNTTPAQIKMFLTRLGFGSKMIVTGDLTQIDLPGKIQSGLKVAHQILKATEGVSFIHLGESDVVRHPLVQRIIRAYDEQQE
ncbi:PhoH family protein [Aureibacillus halotolerans]|uniref:PhoH-like protein n=1 Tax=Aureibacillus halotolerans TaxID=1508390 RepID=A0A4V3D5X1_9BACI|nr:PhoH family protein [Aureibacillus halotolerans]TDQ41737.1 phosphate starvation-inducible PhoH-like protein [Aureibacillus halotolerans]